MNATQTWIASLASLAAGVAMAIIGGVLHIGELLTAGIAIATGAVAWFGLKRPVDKVEDIPS